MTLCRMETELDWTIRAIAWRRAQLAAKPQSAVLRWRIGVLCDRAAGLRDGIRGKRLDMGLGVTANGGTQMVEAI